jgi:hypothetical protein
MEAEVRIEEPTPRNRGGTYVKDRATAERMQAGAQRHLNSLGENQIGLRVHGIKLSANQLKGAIRQQKRKARRAAFKTSDGFEVSARATRVAPGLSDKAAARKRAREFNAQHGGQNGTGTGDPNDKRDQAGD